MYLDRAGLFNSEYRKIERLIMIMVNAVSLEGPCNDFATFTEYFLNEYLKFIMGGKRVATLHRPCVFVLVVL